jgi:hypothetical protein
MVIGDALGGCGLVINLEVPAEMRGLLETQFNGHHFYRPARLKQLMGCPDALFI